MKVVISGGAGSIGRRLAERLLARGTLAGLDGRPAEILSRPPNDRLRDFLQHVE